MKVTFTRLGFLFRWNIYPQEVLLTDVLHGLLQPLDLYSMMLLEVKPEPLPYMSFSIYYLLITPLFYATLSELLRA
jgi:hypothetical protein